jgi:MFS family permease
MTRVLGLFAVAYKIPDPVMIYLQSAYFNGGQPCVTKLQTDSAGCKQALSTISFVTGWFQVGAGVSSFVLSPILGRLSDSYGRRNILLLSLLQGIMPATVLFLGQTVVMSNTPWLWIYYSVNIVNIGGGVSSAYLADIMPPEWRSVAFGVTVSIYALGSVLGPLVDLIPFPKSGEENVVLKTTTYDCSAQQSEHTKLLQSNH